MVCLATVLASTVVAGIAELFATGLVTRYQSSRDVFGFDVVDGSFRFVQADSSQ